MNMIIRIKYFIPFKREREGGRIEILILFFQLIIDVCETLNNKFALSCSRYLVPSLYIISLNFIHTTI